MDFLHTGWMLRTRVIIWKVWKIEGADGPNPGVYCDGQLVVRQFLSISCASCNLLLSLLIRLSFSCARDIRIFSHTQPLTAGAGSCHSFLSFAYTTSQAWSWPGIEHCTSFPPPGFPQVLHFTPGGPLHCRDYCFPIFKLAGPRLTKAFLLYILDDKVKLFH